jgi:hypothetical protein
VGRGGGDVRQSNPYSAGSISSCGFSRVGRRRGVRRLLQSSRRDPSLRKAEEDARVGRISAVRAAIHGAHVRVFLLPDPDRRREGRFHLFEPYRGRSRGDKRAKGWHRSDGRRETEIAECACTRRATCSGSGCVYSTSVPTGSCTSFRSSIKRPGSAGSGAAKSGRECKI